MLEALLFDLDGTLANTDPIHFQAWRDILHEYDWDIDYQFYQARFSGRLNAAIIQELLPHLSPEQGQQLSQRKEIQFRQQAEQQLKPLAGVSELLNWAETQNLKEAVVTNAPKENAQFMLQVLGLEKRLTTVILAEDLEKGKPDPMPYQVALERLGVSPQSAVAFEDSPTGIRSAVSAGLLTVGIASTHDCQELIEVGATLVVSDLTDSQLAQLLQFCWRQRTATPT